MKRGRREGTGRRRASRNGLVKKFPAAVPLDLYETLKTLAWDILLAIFLGVERDNVGGVSRNVEDLQETILRGQFSLFPAAVRTPFWTSPRSRGLKQIWPVVNGRVLLLFQTSLSAGELPTPWKNAKIIPFKVLNRVAYTAAKAWRPLSLLSTLGKALEAIVAEGLSYAAETFGVLPTNHFGARKGRSAEQALVLLQEHVYNALEGEAGAQSR